VHQEYFTARELTEEEKAWDERPFTVRLARTNKTLEVEPGQSIVDVLREAGLEVRTDCQEGYCGTCITRYLEGDPVHRDTVLDDDDRRNYVMICCARSRSKQLLLDL
jgi:vanillate O-demethylase ferredoxin subunit